MVQRRVSRRCAGEGAGLGAWDCGAYGSSSGADLSAIQARVSSWRSRFSCGMAWNVGSTSRRMSSISMVAVVCACVGVEGGVLHSVKGCSLTLADAIQLTDARRVSVVALDAGHLWGCPAPHRPSPVGAEAATHIACFLAPSRDQSRSTFLDSPFPNNRIPTMALS